MGKLSIEILKLEQVYCPHCKECVGVYSKDLKEFTPTNSNNIQIKGYPIQICGQEARIDYYGMCTKCNIPFHLIYDPNKKE